MRARSILIPMPRKATTSARAAPREPAPAPEAPPTPAAGFAVDAARCLADDKCADVLVLDLRGRSQVTDYFVIGTGTSERQMRAVAQHVDQLAGERGMKVFRTNMHEPGQNWIVIDFVDVVVHLFDGAMRGYYYLELLWGDAARVDWARPIAAAAPAPKRSRRASPAKKKAPAASAPRARKPRGKA